MYHQKVKKNDKELFREALLEARTRKNEAIIRACPDDVTPDPCRIEEIRQMLRMQSIAIAKKAKRRVVIALVAALLALLAGCTVYIYRHKIGNMIEHVFGDHAKMVAEEPLNENMYAIPEKDRCSLGYIPEGYEVFSQESALHIIYILENDTKEKIKIEQTFIDNMFKHDVEQGYSNIKTINSMQIYYREWETYNGYIWTDETYVYKLIVPTNISQDEVLKIIENIAPKK